MRILSSVVYRLPFIVWSFLAAQTNTSGCPKKRSHVTASKEIDNEVKAYALFFLNVIFIDMGKRTSFDWLLKDYVKILPLSVQLGISHEGKHLKERTALMRRHDRALHRAIKMSEPMADTLEKMYGRPIRSLRATQLKIC
jgi:hypothetical protein